MKFLKFLFALFFLLFSFCAHSVNQFYPDRYFKEDHVYENKSLRFLLTFKSNWNIITDPALMDRQNRISAGELNRAGIELLFIGSTFEGYHGTRGITVNLNEPASDYAQYIRNLNKQDVQNDKGLEEIEEEYGTIVKWEYERSSYRFVEYFVNIDTYDIRIAFWSKPQYFENFISVYDEIIRSLTITSGL